MTPARPLVCTRSLRLWVSVTLALVTGAALLIFAGVAETPTASAAASAPALTQCDPPAYPTGAGYQVTCTVTVENTVTAGGTTNSTVTATACLAAAGVLPPSGCTTTVTTSTQLVTSVDQCNSIVYGGGSNVTCDVTVDQCIGSGTGGGTAPTVVCAPTGSTTNATVTQCNGSGNGGGASTRVKCTVTGAAMALPVAITQCNGSANTGGSTVTCAATINDTFATPPPTTTTTTTTAPSTTTTTTTTTPSTTTTPTTTGPGSGGSSGSGGGSTGTSPVIPTGAPQTGLGGASRSGDPLLVVLGVLALVGAGLSMLQAIRRRREIPVETGSHHENGSRAV